MLKPVSTGPDPYGICPLALAQVLAILMDVFTDVEIFCDILEAANKRGVLVCVLLDRGGVPLFREMCDKAQVSDRHLKVSPEGSLKGTLELPSAQ